MSDMMQWELPIVKSRKAEFIKKIESLNRKAVKMNINQIEYSFGSEFTKDVEVEYQLEPGSPVTKAVDKKITFINVTLNYLPIKQIGEWTVGGIIERSDIDGENFVNAIHDEISAKDYYHHELTCDHCRINRYRNTCVILKNNNEIKVVGKTCLKEFLGIDPSQVLASCGFIDTFIAAGKEFSNGGSGEYHYNIEEIIKITMSVMKDNNWKFISSRSDFGTPTVNQVFGFINDRKAELFTGELADKLFEQVNANIEEFLEKFEAEIEMDPFIRTIALIAKIGSIPQSKMSTFVGYVGSWLYKNVAANGPKVNPANCQFFGTISEKITFVGVIDKVKRYEGKFGPGYVIVGHVENTDNIFKTFTSVLPEFLGINTADNFIPNGVGYALIGTVKDHCNDHIFGRSTLLTRLKEPSKKGSKNGQ